MMQQSGNEMGLRGGGPGVSAARRLSALDPVLALWGWDPRARTYDFNRLCAVVFALVSVVQSAATAAVVAAADDSQPDLYRTDFVSLPEISPWSGMVLLDPIEESRHQNLETMNTPPLLRSNPDTTARGPCIERAMSISLS